MNIADFSKEYGVNFFHGMPSFQPTDHTLVHDASLKEKVATIRVVEGELCCSSFLSNIPHQGRDFGNAMRGVLLGDGEIIFASNTDAGSVMQADATRTVLGQKTQTTEDMERAVLARSNTDPYNEIIVKNPKIAGVYIMMDDKNHQDNLTWQNANQLKLAFEKLQEHSQTSVGNDLPVLVIKNGEVRQFMGFRESFVESYALSSRDFERTTTGGALSAEGDYKTKSFKEDFNHDGFMDRFAILSPPLAPETLQYMAHNNQLGNHEKTELFNEVKHRWDQRLVDHVQQNIFDNNISNTGQEMHGVDQGVSVVPTMSAHRLKDKRHDAEQMSPKISSDHSKTLSL